ncbi:hypothetical protein SDC9_211004 [bioreactor metagenome]|uniref:Uncharacterized protein n=1 Tax=bioreactor metagenome TaxID=1076179 RepID=A0A645JIR9_9ZZZZ
MVFDAVHKGHGINNHMIVQVVAVKVRANDSLKTLPETATGKLHADCVGLLRRHLSRLERLDEVIGQYAARLGKPLFCGNHFPVGSTRTLAVDGTFK